MNFWDGFDRTFGQSTVCTSCTNLHIFLVYSGANAQILCSLILQNKSLMCMLYLVDYLLVPILQGGGTKGFSLEKGGKGSFMCTCAGAAVGGGVVCLSIALSTDTSTDGTGDLSISSR